MKKLFAIIPFAGLLLVSCQPSDKQQLNLVDATPFQTQIDGKTVDLYTLQNQNGMAMQVTNFGGHVVSLFAPDKNGVMEDVVLGHNTLDEYVNPTGERFIGCVVGRYANRIANGQFSLNGETYNLPINNNGQSLHGGLKGLDLVVWDVDTVANDMIRLSYLSPDGEEGYPGNLNVTMTYTLTDNNEFKIEYSATTDKSTVVNLSHHGFFNLKGEGKGTINDHILTINADSITPVNEVLIPFGKHQVVEGTPFDFRNGNAIGERVNTEGDEQLTNGKGYDHNWVLNRKTDNEVELAVTLYEPQSGRMLEVLTNQPGVQFYGGNFFDGSGKGKNGATFNFREALALETQKFPDSPNQPSFPSTVLNPGETYNHICIYRFSTK